MSIGTAFPFNQAYLCISLHGRCLSHVKLIIPTEISLQPYPEHQQSS